MGEPPPEPFRLSLPPGRRFCIRHVPSHEPSGAVLFVHAFAEEMNKSRRMAALQSRAFAAQGFTVLQVDLFACGDSDGDFADSRWEIWLDDVTNAAAWLRESCGVQPVLWGHRAGCLLVAEAAARSAVSTDMVFWQPTPSGQQLLRQFLRMEAAGGIIDGTPGTARRTSSPNTRLDAGETLEIGGYRLAPELARSLSEADLRPPPVPGRVAWLEVADTPDASLTPAAQTRVSSWREGGHAVSTQVVCGPPFWHSTEIVECADLLPATQALVAAWQT